MSDTIQIISATTVQRDVKGTFHFLADLRNDEFWRKEVHKIFIENPKEKLDSLALEIFFFTHQKPKHHILFRCSELIENESVSYESVFDHTFYANNQVRINTFLNNTPIQTSINSILDSPLYLRYTRKVTYLADEKTQITCQMDFDKNLPAHGLGLNLPTFFVKQYLKQMMKQHLHKLKKAIEDKNIITWNA